MGAFLFASFILTSIILTNAFGGIDAGPPTHGKKPHPPKTVDWRGKLILKIRLGALALSSCLAYTTQLAKAVLL